MNKKFLSAILFGALMVTSTGTFVSCKDYDDDIDDLWEAVNGKASVEDLTSKVNTLETALNEAKATTAEAKQAAEEANRTATEAGQTAEAAKQAVEAAKQEAKLEAIAAAQEEVAALKRELESSIGADQETLTALQEKVESLVQKVGDIIGHRLTSIAFVPKTNINGIPAIVFKSIHYIAKKATKDEGVLETVVDAKKNNVVLTLSSDSTMAYYRLNPRIGVTTEDFGFPSFSCITSENYISSRAVDEKLAMTDSPIRPVPGQKFTISEDGVLAVRVEKTTTTSISSVISEEKDHENFYMASLNVPIAEKNWTEDETAENAPSVHSEYVRIEETSNPIFIQKAGVPTEDEDAHYFDYTTIYASTPASKVSWNVEYNKEFDLLKTVEVCYKDQTGDTRHEEVINYANYGLVFEFSKPTKAYMDANDGTNRTDQQQFYELSGDNNHILKSKVYTVGGNNMAAIDREPIVCVTLKDSKNGYIVDQRYMKIKFVRETIPAQQLPAYTFANDTVSCNATEAIYGTVRMNEDIYAKAKEGGMTKEAFHAAYPELKIKSLVKTTGSTSVDLMDEEVWTAYKLQQVDKYATNSIADNQGDLEFKYVTDENNGVTSYNIVWRMSPHFVGTVDQAAKFVLTAQFVDKTGVNGTIEKDFILNIIIPNQNFAYQGTYWKNGVGSGTFNVNPIVYRTTDHGVQPEYESHISADLISGYVYTKTEKKPAILSELIALKRGMDGKMLQSCANAHIIFDEAKFSNYEHLAAYYTESEGQILQQYQLNADGTIKTESDKPVKGGDEAARIVNVMDYDDNEDAFSSTIQLNEDCGDWPAFVKGTPKGQNGLSAAINLIGKAVPVKMVVEYNDSNKVVVDEFETYFIKPLNINGSVKDSFTDAVVNGSFVDVASGFTMTDWNNYIVAAQTRVYDSTDKNDTPLTEYEKYAAELYQYYNVQSVVWDVDKATTNLKLEGNTYTPTEGVKNGQLPTGNSLKQMDDNNNEVTKNPTKLGYFNNNGTPVNVAYKLYVPVKVTYKWGEVVKEDVEITVNPAAGTIN